MAQAQEDRKELWAAMMKESLHRAVVRVLIDEWW